MANLKYVGPTPSAPADISPKSYIDDLAAVRVSGSNNGTATNLTLWIGTAAQYAAIGTKDPSTVYMVTA